MVKTTGSVVVVNMVKLTDMVDEVKMPGLVVVFNVVKMMGLMIVDALAKSPKYHRPMRFCVCADQLLKTVISPIFAHLLYVRPNL